MPEPEKVMCADCGLLAVLHKQSGEYVAADKRFRETGEIPNDREQYIHHACPLCAAMVADFRAIIGQPNPENDGQNRCRVIRDPRTCDEFIPWNPCFSPKEHKEMKLSKDLLEMQREREDADREWRRKADVEDRQWRSEQATSAEARHKEQLAAALEQVTTQREGVANDTAFYRRYLRVMWIGVSLATLTGIAAGLISGSLSSRTSKSEAAERGNK